MNDRKENSLRRNNKPLMEKRRRARINSCLGELKGLILQAMKKENSQFSKLEKADILEMTVKYLRHVQRSQITSAISDPTVVAKYQTGFGECAREVIKCLDGFQGMGKDLQCRLSQHLSQRMYSMPPTQASALSTTPPMQLIQPMHVQIPSGHIGNLVAVSSVGGIPAHALSQLNFPAENTPRLHVVGNFLDYRKTETLSSPPVSRSPTETRTSTKSNVRTIPVQVPIANEEFRYMSRASPISPEIRISSAYSSSGGESACGVTRVSTKSAEHKLLSISHESSNNLELNTMFANTMANGFSLKRRAVPVDCSTVSRNPAEENVWRPW